MIAESSTFNLFDLSNLFIVFKGGFVAFGILYFLFSLIVIRQVALMTNTVITEAGFFLRILAIAHSILSLLLVLYFLTLF